MTFFITALCVSLFLSKSMGNGLIPILGSWIVVDTGADCISTGWVQDAYESKNGKIIGTKVSIKSNTFSWGKLTCTAPIISRNSENELDFFDGSECKSSPGILPKSCADLMNKLKKSKVTSFQLKCTNDAPIPYTYMVLSKDYLLASVDGDFICLKRQP
ncbi:MAG: hypothetical protein ACOYOK_08340 [Pseudobdellovibrionaceae bacterium]